MSSPAKPNDTRTPQQIEKDAADRIEAAMLYRRIQQAAAWSGQSNVGALTLPTKILAQN